MDKPTLEQDGSGGLILRKDRPGPLDVANCAALISLSLFYGGVFCVMPFGAKVPPSWTGTVILISIGIAILVLGPWEARRHYRRIKLGVWRIDGRGIDFQATRGSDQNLLWGEFVRVKFGDHSCWLVDPVGSIRLTKDGLYPTDWATVVDRIKAGLAPRFDLTTPLRTTTVPSFSFHRVLAVTLPLCLVTMATHWAISRVPPLWVAVRVLGWLLLLALWTVGLIGRYRRAQGPRISSWRTPRRVGDDKTVSESGIV